MATSTAIHTTDDQDVLFEACDAGIPIRMQRNGHTYLVIREDRMDSLAALVSMHDARRKIIDGSMTDLLPGLIAAGQR